MGNYKYGKSQIERIVQLELFFDLELSVNAYHQVRHGRDSVSVIGEIIGIQLQYDLLVLGELLDPSGKVRKESSIRIEAEKFDGISPFQMNFLLTNDSNISKIRIYPILEVMKQPYYISGLYPVVGIAIPSRSPFVINMKIGDGVMLLREPENSYDRNAIRVLDPQGNILGYIAKELAYMLSVIMDASSIIGMNAEIRSKKRKAFYVEIINEPELLGKILHLKPK